MDREKKDSTGQEKTHKRIIFHQFGENALVAFSALTLLVRHSALLTSRLLPALRTDRDAGDVVCRRRFVGAREDSVGVVSGKTLSCLRVE